MPQLDKLTFTSQVFWFFVLFVFLYYSMIQMTLVRVKLILGLKRFFFQSDKNNSFYDLSKKLKVSSRYDLLFFFDNLNNNTDTNFSYNLLKRGSGSSFLFNYMDSIFNFINKSVNFLTALVGTASKEKASLFSYNYVLDLNKSAYVFSYLYLSKHSSLELKDFSNLTKSILYFYEQFLNVFSFFFKAVQFYIYDTVFVLFYYFFNVFFKFREILYFFKLLNKFSI